MRGCRRERPGERPGPLVPATPEPPVIFGLVPRPEAPLFLGARGKRLDAAVAQRTLRLYRRQNGLPEHATPVDPNGIAADNEIRKDDTVVDRAGDTGAAA
jgi:hypothetical protein